jgi:battenin
LIDLITPNVHPPVRILLTLLAAAATAASEVTHLGLLRYYGKTGLAGWGLGTGAGAIAVAIMPYIVTYRMGLFLRSAVHYTYYLIPMMLIGYYVVLPRSHIPRSGHNNERNVQDMDLGDDDVELLAHGITATPTTFRQSIQDNLKLFRLLTMPYMFPLFASAVFQGIIFPGVTRAYPSSSSFEAYSAYFAAYGFAFQLGNMLGRVSAVFMRSQKGKSPMTRLCVVSVLAVINACFLFFTWPIVVFVLVLVVGFMCGTVYSNTFTAVLEDSGPAAGNREFSLGVIGIGETEGVLIAAFIGAALESSICSFSFGSGQRWCHNVR